MTTPCFNDDPSTRTPQPGSTRTTRPRTTCVSFTWATPRTVVSCSWFIMKTMDSFASSARGPRPRPNETYMKKPEKTTPPLPKVTRGKYTNLLQQGTNLIILDPALMPHFPDSASVNRALHAFLAINDHVRSAAALPRSRRRPAASAEPAFDPRVGTRTASR